MQLSITRQTKDTLASRVNNLILVEIPPVSHTRLQVSAALITPPRDRAANTYLVLPARSECITGKCPNAWIHTGRAKPYGLTVLFAMNEVVPSFETGSQCRQSNLVLNRSAKFPRFAAYDAFKDLRYSLGHCPISSDPSVKAIIGVAEQLKRIRFTFRANTTGINPL